LTLVAIGQRIASRGISPVELTERMLDRIGRIDPALKSYATLMGEEARASARTAEREIAAGKYRGPLHGVPIAVKDLCYTKGVRTMGGTKVREHFVPDVDATVVSRLRDAGAVLLGKLNLSEGATAGYNPARDVPLNPWNADRWPGMSSSGSGVATAAGLCFAAIGTDTGGSIRNPASANGVVGLKPTYGRVSRFGVMAMAESLDHVGPIARSVADVALMFDAIAGRDPNDPTSLDAAAPRAFQDVTKDIRGARIGVDRDYALKGIDRGQAAAIEQALQVLSGLGATVVDVRMPDLSGLLDMWSAICGAEIAAAHAATYPSLASEYGPYMREFLATGARVTPQQLAAHASAARRLRPRSRPSSNQSMRSPVPLAAIPPGRLRTRFRSDRCRTITRRGRRRHRAAPSSRCQWISLACPRCVCRADFRRTVCRTASSSRADGSASRCCAASPMRTSRPRNGTRAIRT
jgi:amidase